MEHRITTRQGYMTLCKLPFIAAAFALSMVLFLPANSFAGEACEWSRGNLICKARLWSTGCIGLKNITGKDVRFTVSSDDESDHERVMKKGQTQSADFKGRMAVWACEELLPAGTWRDISCYDAFDRVRHNASSGGGCGCIFYSCLKTP